MTDVDKTGDKRSGEPAPGESRPFATRESGAAAVSSVDIDALLPILLAQAPSYVALIDEDHRIQYLNRQLPEIGTADVVGRRVYDFLQPGHVEHTRQALERVFRTGETTSYVSEAVGPHGSATWYESQFGPIIKGDKVVGVSVVSSDITDRKRTAEALQEQKDFSETLIATAQTIILVLDGEGRIVRCNPYFERVSGYRLDEVKGCDWFSTFLPPGHKKHIRKLFAHAASGFPTTGNVNPIVTKSGELREIEWWDDTLTNSRGEILGVLAIGQDVTERRQAERAVRELNATLERRVAERTAALQQANQELEAFSYSVSHDLRATLRAIANDSSMLRDDLGPNAPEENQRQLERIGVAVRRMERLIEDLLALSRLSVRPVNAATVDLSAVASEVLANLRLRDPARVVAVEVQPNLLAQVDPGQLRIALENLLGNAWKFTAHTEDATIRFGREPVSDGSDAFYVRDNGAGFDVAHADQLFSAFQRLHPSAEFEGTGLGLAAVQRVIQGHGGRIWAEAAVGEGAAFFFTLPAPGAGNAVNE